MPQPKKSSKRQPERQVDRFRKAAKGLETDLNEDRFKQAVKKVAEAPDPPPSDEKSDEDEPGN